MFGPGGSGVGGYGGVPNTVGLPSVRSFEQSPFPSPPPGTQTLQGAFLYIDTGGATTNSGSTDSNTATYTGTAATASGTVVTLDGSPDLSVLFTSGPTQSSILLQQATNTNRKIFWIVGVDNTAKTVTVDVAPTGITTGSWAIGGRHVLTNASIEGALRAGDTAVFNNSPASSASALWTFRNAGDSTNGYAKISGKIVNGVRPILTVTSNANAVNCNNLASVWVENLDLLQSVSTGAPVLNTGSGNAVMALNLFARAKASGGGAIAVSGTGFRIINCYVTNTLGLGIDVGPTLGSIIGCYINGCAGHGVLCSSTIPNISIINSIISGNSGRGIYFSGAPSNQGHNGLVYGCTIYGNMDSGIEIADRDHVIAIINNIVHSNGANGNYNIAWRAGNAELCSFHAWNDYFQGSASAGGNLLNLLVNAQVAGSEIVADPLLADPANSDFRLRTQSPAFNAGFPGELPWVNGGIGHLDLGALQRIAGGSRRVSE